MISRRRATPSASVPLAKELIALSQLSDYLFRCVQAFLHVGPSCPSWGIGPRKEKEHFEGTRPGLLIENIAISSDDP